MKTTLFIFIFVFSLISCTGNPRKDDESEESRSKTFAAHYSAPADQPAGKTLGAAISSGDCQVANERVTDVYISEKGHAILYDINDKKGLILIEDKNHLFTILETTTDNSWVIAEKAPSEVGAGRVETEYILFYTPEARQIDIETLNPSVTGQGMHFGRAFDKPQLIAYLKGSLIPVPLSFENLLNENLPEIPEPAEKENPLTNTGNEAVILELMLGKEEHQLGQGVVYKQLRQQGGIYGINAMPSFAACDSQLFIIDAINFRVLIYDMAGKRSGKIGYPEEKEGIPVVMEDIAIDGEFIYLFSSQGLYVGDRNGEGRAVYVGKEDHELYSRGKTSLPEENRYPVSAYGDHNYLNVGRYFVVKKDDNTILGIFDSGHSDCMAGFLAVDLTGNIYVTVDEVEHPGAQFPGKKTVRVICPEERKQLYSLEVRSWPGGPVKRSLIVTDSGKIFDAFYDSETGFEEETPSKLTIKRIK